MRAPPCRVKARVQALVVAASGSLGCRPWAPRPHGRAAALAARWPPWRLRAGGTVATATGTLLSSAVQHSAGPRRDGAKRPWWAGAHRPRSVLAEPRTGAEADGHELVLRHEVPQQRVARHGLDDHHGVLRAAPRAREQAHVSERQGRSSVACALGAARVLALPLERTSTRLASVTSLPCVGRGPSTRRHCSLRRTWCRRKQEAVSLAA